MFGYLRYVYAWLKTTIHLTRIYWKDTKKVFVIPYPAPLFTYEEYKKDQKWQADALAHARQLIKQRRQSFNTY